MKGRAIGLMTGTSMDGVSACVLETDLISHRELLEGIHIPFPKELHNTLKSLEHEAQAMEGELNLDTHHDIVETFTQVNIDASNILLEKHPKIDIIGFHGQTIYHNPSKGITLQIGNAEMLQRHTGVPVAYDFRSDDVANGGQGAPLAPLYHDFLARSLHLYPMTFVNCGGVANITIVDGTSIIGFDTGPGNTLLDRFVAHKTSGKMLYDKDGEFGLAGRVNKSALQDLYSLAFPKLYTKRSYPKSLDANEITLPKIILDLTINDGCATLAKFTADTISAEIYKCTQPKAIVLSGGGWHNKCILKHFISCNKNPNTIIKTAEGFGFSTDYMEAELMAFLALKTLRREAVSLPAITGARKQGYAKIL